MPPGLTVLYKRDALLRRGLVSDDQDLFWGEYSNANGLLMHAAAKSGGGEVRTLGRWYDYPSPQTLALSAEHVYWMRNEPEGRFVVRVPKQGGAETLYPLPVPEDGFLTLGYIAFREGAIWLASLGCIEIVRLDPESGEATLFPMRSVPDYGRSTGFVVHDGKVYCGNGPIIHVLDLESGRATEVISEQTLVGSMIWVEGTIYFIDNQPVAGKNERLKSWKPGETSAIDLGPAFGYTPTLLLDAERRTLYWATGLNRVIGSIAKMSLDGNSEPVQVLDSLDVMGGITQDADYLYWLGDRSIYRLQKP